MNLKFIAPAIGVAVAVIAVALVMSSDSTSFNESSTISAPLSEPTITEVPLVEPTPAVDVSSESLETVSTETTNSPAIEQPKIEAEIMTTNGQKHIIPLNKIKSGGPPPDGIPSIDDPKFVTSSDQNHVDDADVVIGLEINGDARAYPLSILVWHEIVNDVVGGVPVAITYCPLCYTNQVFERVLDGQPVEFGTSGKLYNSNLVMYDRMTGTYWSQALGTAITGELTGQQLKIIPFDVISWGDWKQLHPDSLVLTTDTGHIRAYGVDPYGDYYTNYAIYFPIENEDDRMHPKEIILGFHVGQTFKAYKQQDVESSTVINDTIEDTSVMLVSQFAGDSRAFDRTVDGQTLEFDYQSDKIIDLQTRSEWNYDGIAVSGKLQGTQLMRLGFNPGFWFEWVAFHPETLVYGEP